MGNELEIIQNSAETTEQPMPVMGKSLNGKSRIKSRIVALSPYLFLAAITLACLVPFINKAFHIDDPLFVWCAKHIQSHPFDFYGFQVNWDGQWRSMAETTQNPPLAAYYMAFIGTLFGWNEMALHAGFLLPALAVVLGTYRLAQNFCGHPFWAALVVATAPVFVLSSTTVMCDVMMLAFWVWAVLFWIEGLRGGHVKLCSAALLISAASLTKYFGLSLVPLLLAYTWFEKRRMRWSIFYLALPLVPLLFYQWLTRRLYGENLLLNAASFAVEYRVGGGWPLKLLAGFAFIGGGMVFILAAAFQLWTMKRLLFAGIPAVFLTIIAIVIANSSGVSSVAGEEKTNWLILIQAALFAVTGASLFLILFTNVANQRSPLSILLALWIVGTFVFTCAINWTVSGRNMLPMLPAVALLLTTRLEAQGWFSNEVRTRTLLVPLGISIAVALMITHADYESANSARNAASVLAQKLSTMAPTTWFEGHWGFQYYMEQLGGKPVDKLNPRLTANDAVIVPIDNSDLFAMSSIEPWFQYVPRKSRWLTTMNDACGAGFYSDRWGPMPFIFCTVPSQPYLIYRVRLDTAPRNEKHGATR